ncbi:MAG: glycosyltransferase 87 family protein [Pseudonocardiaceae bacterium]
MIALSVLGTVALVAGRVPSPHIDLEVYRFGVQAWWYGGDVYGPMPETELGNSLPFIYPPFSLLALSPLTILPWTPAVIALFLVNLLCIAATLYLVARRLWPRLGVRGALLITAPAVPLALLLEPINQTFGFGQINLILMGLVAVDCLTEKPRWPRGIGVGIAAAIKLTPAAFVLFFLLRKDFRAAVTAFLTGAVATGVGFLADNSASVQYWFGGFAGAAGVSGSPFRTNQTFFAVLARFDLPPPVTNALWLGLVLTLFVLAAWVMYRSEPVLALTVCAVFALVASPTSWSHHWVWVAPALLAMVGYAARLRGAGSPAAMGWLAATLLTVSVFTAAPFHDLPGYNNAELDWSTWQQVVGSAYVLLAVGLLSGYAAAVLGRRGASPRTCSNGSSPVGSNAITGVDKPLST